MLRRLLKDGAVYGVAALLSRGVSFLLVPLYTRALRPAEYGVLDIILVLANLVNLTVALEISQGFARHFADARAASERRAYASTTLWFTVAAYLGFAAVALSMAPWLGPLVLGSDVAMSVVWLAVAWMTVNGLFYLVQNQLRWELRPLAYAAASLALAFGTLVLALLLVAVAGLGLRGILLAQLGGALLGAGTGFALARRNYGALFDGRRLREMLRFSLPLVPSGVAVFVALYADRLALKYFMSMTEVGLFGVGYRVAAVVGLVMVAFQGALTPLIYAHHSAVETPAQLARVFRYFVALVLVLCVSLTAFAPEIVRVFATPVYAEAATVVPLLAPAVLLATMYIFAPGFAIAKRTVPLALVNGAGAIMNVILNLLLIPVLGMIGAALATLGSAAGVFAAYMISSQRLYPVPHRWRAHGVALAGAIAAALLSALLPSTFIGMAGKLLLIAAATTVVLRSGLVDASELRRLLVRRPSEARGGDERSVIA